MKGSVIKQQSFSFPIRVVKLYQYLTVEKCEFVFSKQLLRSKNSIDATIRESQHAETDMGFIYKPGIAQKETDETLYWLEPLNAMNYLTNAELKSIHKDATELMKIICSIITKKKTKPNNITNN